MSERPRLHPSRRAAASLTLLALGVSLTACAQPKAAPTAAAPRGPSSQAIVFPVQETRLTLAQSPAEPPSESWAEDRHDRSLAVGVRTPLLATRQWPEPLPPPERPVWFRRWVQH